MIFTHTDISQLASKRVLVTGASGFIGSNLASRLVAAGAEVHGTSRSEREETPSNIKWWKGSLMTWIQPGES